MALSPFILSYVFILSSENIKAFESFLSSQLPAQEQVVYPPNLFSSFVSTKTIVLLA